VELLTSSTLAIVVVGASGDLAEKKTYPSLLDLYHDNFLPKNTLVVGYARSNLTDDDLRDKIRPFLLKTQHSEAVVERFLKRCVYQGGKSYVFSFTIASWQQQTKLIVLVLVLQTFLLFCVLFQIWRFGRF
jgi:glucose-6-phosphate 1-dehydrogenase